MQVIYLCDIPTTDGVLDRMPPQMGELISEAVYDGLLKSNPHHPIGDNIMACHFVDVPSNERRKDDSFMVRNVCSKNMNLWLTNDQNEGERDAVIQIARHLQDKQLNYKIISPYDAQRNFIETKMKNSPEGVRWENTCFNVDSFQGNIFVASYFHSKV